MLVASCWVKPQHHPTLLSTCQATPGVLCPVLVLTVKQYCGETGKGPKESHEKDQRAREPALCGKTEAVRSSLTEQRRLGEDLMTVFWYLKGSCKEGGGSVFTRNHMDKTRGKWVQVLSQYKKDIFYSENDRSPEQPPQGCG